jgi:hypothetical protein
LVLFAYATRRHATHPGATTVGPSTVTEPERKFLGNWTSTGRGVGICKRNWIMNCDGEGKWFLRESSIVWI